MATPTLFTQTPVESSILAVGLRIQESIASIFLGTAVFNAIAIAFLGLTIIICYLKLLKGEMTQGQLATRVIFQLAGYMLAFSVLSSGISAIQFGSTENKVWSSYEKISKNPKFAGLSDDFQGLFWYLKIQGAFQGLSNVMTETIGKAFDDATLNKDPAFFYKEISKSAVSALNDKETAALFSALLRDCTDSSKGKLVNDSTSLSDLFDLENTEKNCSALWAQFEANTEALARNIARDNYNQPSFSDFFKTVANYGITPESMANLAVANSVINYAKSLEGYTASQATRTSNFAATYSDNPVDAVAGVLDNPNQKGVTYLINMLGLSDRDAGIILDKAEIASTFNQIAYLIPVTRAIVQVILGLAFIFVIFALGCGYYRPFITWLFSMALLSLYQPLASLVYKLPIYFMDQVSFMENSEKIEGDLFSFVGVRLLNDQITQIQIVCIIMQISVFMLCVVGAVKMTWHFRAASGQWGASVFAAGTGLVTRLGGGASSLPTMGPGGKI